MRILGFSKPWPKLNQLIFITFRFQRRDRDWELMEQVQVVLNPRSKKHKLLGIAEIVGKEPKNMSIGTQSQYPVVTVAEAKTDGFDGYWPMWEWLYDIYGDKMLLDEPMNKLTLIWRIIEEAAFNQ